VLRRQDVRLLIVLTLLWATPHSTKAQTFDRTYYEVGVVYDDRVFSATAPCNLDDFRFYVGWNDDANNSTELFQQINQTPFPAPINTAYYFRVPRHYYTAPGKYGAEITEILHCSGANGASSATKFVELTAQARGSVGSLKADPEYKPGQEVTIVVSAPADSKASESGTRVYLKAVSGGGVIDPSEPLAAYVDIPPGGFEIKTKFRLGKLSDVSLSAEAKAALFATVTISGTASNTQTVSFRVRP
jgi:hypothetical protein